jgi:hypothetical protein
MRAKMDKVRRRKERRKKVRTARRNDNQLTHTTRTECKCGGDDHKRTSLLRCSWKGLSELEVVQNYEKRMSENVVPQKCEENTVDPTTEPMSEATEKGG